MESHGLGVKTVYEIYNRKGGELIYSNENNKVGKAEVQIKINNPGQSERIITFPFRSYVSNFSRVLQYGLLAIDNSTAGAAIDKIIKTTTGGATYAAAEIQTMAVNEIALTGAAQTAYGIWIGDIDNLSGHGLTLEAGIGGSVAYNDYMLRGLLLANGGTPDTDINYLATNVTFSNSDNTLTVSRRFQNVSATIDTKITEIGLVGKSGTDYFLLARDRVTDGTNAYFLLSMGGTVEVSYIFTITDILGFTQNYLKMLSSEFLGANALSQVRDINNVAQTINFSSARTQKDLLAAATSDLYGILVGYQTGVFNTSAGTNTPYTVNTQSYNIGSKISHGVIVNTLYHGVVTAVVMEQTLNKTTFGLYRDFENQYTSLQVPINNSGLVIRQGTSPYTYYLIATDYVPSIGNYLQVAPNQVLRVKYIFEAPL